MSHDWFKMHNDFINDPKMKRYFTKSERLDWVNLLCLSSKSRERGVLTMPDDEISYALDLEDDEWLALREKLIERKMVAIREEDDALVILNWDERQYDKPSDTPAATAERKRRSRASQSAQIVPDVTPLSRPVTPCHATDKRRGEERRVEEILPTGGGAREETTAPVLDAKPRGKDFDPSLPLPLEVENFIGVQENPERWRSALVLELTGRTFTGDVGSYAMSVLRRWKGSGGPPAPRVGPTHQGHSRKPSARERVAAATAARGARLVSELTELGISTGGVN